MKGKNSDRKDQEGLGAVFRELNGGGEEHVDIDQITNRLEETGISKEDPRIKKILGSYLQEGKASEKKLSKEKFLTLINKPGSELLKKAFTGRLVIPDFADFKKDIEEIFQETKSNESGDMDDTVPHPEKVRQPAYAVSICTVDGQLLQLGDHDLAFLLQSICKPVNYAIAYEEIGKEKVHQHVGVEPGDESFESSSILNSKNLPHNPLITSGAIMTAALIKPGLDIDERLQHVMEVWGKITGDKEIGYNEDSFRAEQKEANEQAAFAHLMKQRGAFPEGVEDLQTVVDFYLKCCAIEVNIDDLAHASATLANYGKCPSSGKKVFQHDTVRDTLSLMLSSGTYDHSGEFAFRVGMPAKSGIAGGIMVVIPQLMGIAIYSPPLDQHGNSVRGIEFCEKLVDRFNFHKFDALGTSIHGKKDPRRY